jgi:hypothetical protein
VGFDLAAAAGAAAKSPRLVRRIGASGRCAISFRPYDHQSNWQRGVVREAERDGCDLMVTIDKEHALSAEPWEP